MIEGEPAVNGRLLAALSHGLIKARLESPGGMLAKNDQRAVVTYLVTAGPDAAFTKARVTLKVDERIDNSLAVAPGRAGDRYTDLGGIGDGQAVDLTPHVTGRDCFRFRLTALNTSGENLLFLRGITLDATAE